MNDYSLVRDNNGEIIGFWIKESDIAIDRDRLSMYVIAGLMKESIPKYQIEIVTVGILGGKYRVVPNKYDSAGGCFVMLANAIAPGEEHKEKSSLVQTVKGSNVWTYVLTIFILIIPCICCASAWELLSYIYK